VAIAASRRAACERVRGGRGTTRTMGAEA
jgi:hypothetical protein